MGQDAVFAGIFGGDQDADALGLGEDFQQLGTDRLQKLSGLSRLKTLLVSQTMVSEEGVDRLRAKLPGVVVKD